MRLYICHTYYHVYVSILKELVAQKSKGDRGVVLLSTISTDFTGLEERLKKSNIFFDVRILKECHPKDFKEAFSGSLGTGNWLKKLRTRRRFYQYMVQNEGKYIREDFSKYKEIYVFCDSDPIGYYLNAKHIPYIAVEDGNNSGRYNSVVIANQGFFWLKRILAKCNYLFMQDGYSKYGKAYEVNSAQGVYSKGRRIIECSRHMLMNQLNEKDKLQLYNVFKCWDSLESVRSTKKCAMILTQPLCTEENRIRLYQKIVNMFEGEYNVLIKPHPIDQVDYKKAFPQCIVLKGKFPIEIFNLYCEFDIEKIVTVYSTSLDTLTFAKEKVSLGVDILDEFESPTLHSDLKKKV